MSKQELVVWPNHDDRSNRWITAVDGQMTSSVGSLVEAAERARDHDYELRVPPEAYDQMVAPAEVPETYSDLLGQG